MCGGPSRGLECPDRPTTPVYRPGSHPLGPGNTNTPAGYYPSHTTPGTPPTGPRIHTSTWEPLQGPAQRLRHSVKMVVSGSPIYRCVYRSTVIAWPVSHCATLRPCTVGLAWSTVNLHRWALLINLRYQGHGIRHIEVAVSVISRSRYPSYLILYINHGNMVYLRPSETCIHSPMVRYSRE